MTQELAPAPVALKVNAADAATAWLNAFLATGNDEERPLLHHTLSVEFFRDGVQLIATNGHMLLRTWVPAVRTADDSVVAPWPGIDEAPERAVVVMDVDAFALGFMRTLLAATKEEEHRHEVLSVAVAPTPLSDDVPMLLGDVFASDRLTLLACGQRLDCRLMEDTYPNWRKLDFGVPVERVEGMTISPKYLGIIGKLKGVSRVDLDFRGTARSIDVIGRGETEVRGLLMPMRRPEN